MRVHDRHRGVEPTRVEVIEQQAHVHPALSCLPQRFEKQYADLVLVPNVVLHIERLVSSSGKEDAHA